MCCEKRLTDVPRQLEYEHNFGGKVLESLCAGGV